MAQKYLTRDQILNIPDIESREVNVPEWGGVVIVRGLTGAERDSLESTMIDTRANSKDRQVNLANMRAKLVARAVIDESGVRIFDDNDVEALGRKSASALDRVFAVAQELSGISDKDIETLTKN